MIAGSAAFILTLALGLLAPPLAAEAQPAGKVPRIGFLSPSSASAVPSRTEAFRQGLSELGYVEGQDIVIEYRFAEGKLDRLADLAAELVQLKVDVIVAAVTQASLAAKKRPKRSPSAWCALPIQWGPVSSPVSHIRVGTSRGHPA